ncbi:MAG: DUF4328 domain-containing protein [Ilumatobacteraceae bacterium]
MSEPPLPPPVGAPPPPNPLPNSSDPVGSHRRLRRIGRLGRTAQVLVVTTAALAAVASVTSRLVADEARAFLDGDLDRNDFIEAAAPTVLVTFVQGVALLAAAVTVMVWMHRLAANLRALHRGTTWGPGWAVGCWLLPPLVFILPFLVLREIWRASDPDVGVGEGWRTGRPPVATTIWFVLFGPVQAILQFTVQFERFGTDIGGLGGEEALAEQIARGGIAPVASVLVEIAAAVAFVVVIRSIDGRHRRLIGEGPL